MASKSAGQIIGTAVGAAVGFFVPGSYVALGAALGGMVGGLIDPPKGPTVAGARLDDLSFQTSTLGAPLGRAYGTVPVLGNVVWLEGDKYREVITTEEQGGKGGGGATYETARYYATFAVSLLRVTDPTQTVGLRRLWIGSNLVYDAGSDNLDSIVASNSEGVQFDFYSGTDDQAPNPRWQADKGVDAVSGFPGRCYIVIHDLDLEPYSRSLAMAQVKAELVCGYTTAANTVIGEIINPRQGETDEFTAAYVRFLDDRTFVTGYVSDHVTGACITHEHWVVYKNGTKELLGSTEAYASSGWPATVPLVTQSDVDGMFQIKIEDISPYRQFARLYAEGALGWETLAAASGTFGNGTVSCAAIENDEVFLCGSDMTGAGAAAPVLKISVGGVIAGADNYLCRALGYTENWLYLLDAASTTTVAYIRKLDKLTLATDSTITFSISGDSAIAGGMHVLSDVEIVVWTQWGAYRWVNGNVEYTQFYDSVGDPDYSGGEFDQRRWFKAEGRIWRKCEWEFATTSKKNKVITNYLNIVQPTIGLREIVTSECGLAGIESSDLDLDELTDSTVRGFRIGQSGSPRSSLEMLQAAYPFDVAPSGYSLRFVSRGGASVATIPETDLGATSGGDSSAVLLPVAREMDTQIPYKVAVRYLDPAREYDIAEQYASRPDTASTNQRSVELSLVMTADEAAQCADILNAKDWLERVSYGPFTLPPTYRELEPPDVVTVEHRGQSHELRLTRAETMPDGRIVCAGVPSSVQTYTSTATAQESVTTGQSLVPLKGATEGYLLDIPRIRSEQDVPGMAVALLGVSSGWPGAALLRSDDQGSSYAACASSNTRAKVFYTGTALGSHHGYSIDHGSVLVVTPRYSDHDLSSVTEDQLYSHANLAAYGADGRWEIVAFRTVTDLTGTYRLQDFLRGLYGSEWASGLHEADDLLVMLDTSSTVFFGLPTNAIGGERLYKTITQGASIESAAAVGDTYDAINLKPLSPVDLRGSRDPLTLDWSFAATRRSRTATELLSGVAVPLGESSEAYQAVLFNSDYSIIKRTFSGLSTPEVDYTNAEQVADFGSVQDTLYVDFSQASSVVGQGFALRSSIYRYLSLDPFGDQVVLLQSMNDTGLTDFRGHAVTLVGGVARSATYSQEGGYSASFDGATGYYYLDGAAGFAFGTGDFTIEGFIRPSSTSLDMALFDFRPYGTNGVYPMIYLSSAGEICYYVASGQRILGAHGLSTSAFKHYALVRNAGVSRIYVAGVQIGSDYTDTNNFGISAGRPVFGVSTFSMSSAFYSGYADQQRITLGARYTSSFTPPTSFPEP
jgi:hypothetical protein